MIRIFTALTAALLLCATPSLAQTAKTEAPAVAGEPSARQLSLSRRYVEVMQGDSIEDIIEQLVREMAQSDSNMRGSSQEDREFMIELTTEVTTDIMPQMMEQLVPIYARVFTEAELEALIAFYDTDLGRSITAKMMISSSEAEAAMMTVMPAMMEKMANRICARYGCDPEDYRAEMFGGMDYAPPADGRSSAK